MYVYRRKKPEYLPAKLNFEYLTLQILSHLKPHSNLAGLSSLLPSRNCTDRSDIRTAHKTRSISQNLCQRHVFFVFPMFISMHTVFFIKFSQSFLQELKIDKQHLYSTFVRKAAGLLSNGSAQLHFTDSLFQSKDRQIPILSSCSKSGDLTHNINLLASSLKQSKYQQKANSSQIIKPEQLLASGIC